LADDGHAYRRLVREPATGPPVSITGTDIVRVDDDSVVEIGHVEDLRQLQQQLAGARS
jgi:hypothetical protein